MIYSINRDRYRSKLIDDFFLFLGVVSFTLTFFHLFFWIPILLSSYYFIIKAVISLSHLRLGVNALLFLSFLVFCFFAAVAWGVFNGLYNLKQLIIVSMGCVLGLSVANSQISTFWAWLPVTVAVVVFSSLFFLGWDVNNILPQNSRNFISVILLGLYSTALLLDKPDRISIGMVLIAALIFFLSIWAEGRSGIVSSFLMLTMASVSFFVRSRFFRSKLWIFVILVVLSWFFFFLYDFGMFDRISIKGFTDHSRERIFLWYFSDITIFELFFGRNPEDVERLSKFGFNLHNSYLAALAFGGVFYFFLMVLVVLLSAFKYFSIPFIAIAVIPLSIRALTDIQIYVGKYDFVIVAALFIVLNLKLESLAMGKCRNQTD